MENIKQFTSAETINKLIKVRETYVDDVEFLKEAKKIAEKEVLHYANFCEYVGGDLFPIINMMHYYSDGNLDTIQIIDILLDNAEKMQELINRAKKDPSKKATREEVLIDIMGFDKDKVKTFLEMWDKKEAEERSIWGKKWKYACKALVESIASRTWAAESLQEIEERADKIIDDAIRKINNDEIDEKD